MLERKLVFSSDFQIKPIKTDFFFVFVYQQNVVYHFLTLTICLYSPPPLFPAVSSPLTSDPNNPSPPPNAAAVAVATSAAANNSSSSGPAVGAAGGPVAPVASSQQLQQQAIAVPSPNSGV